MIPYIGCVSREDAEVLKMLAECSQSILEFGAGASTQIFAAYGKRSVDTVESDSTWIEKTRETIERLSFVEGCSFPAIVTYHHQPRCNELWLWDLGFYDLIFIDCADDLRLPWALASWQFLSVGGTMAFHDTRRTQPHGLAPFSDIQNVCQLLAKYSTEIDGVTLNAGDSNTTLVVKRLPLLYENWQVAEGRTDAQMGLE